MSLSELARNTYYELTDAMWHLGLISSDQGGKLDDAVFINREKDILEDSGE